MVLEHQVGMLNRIARAGIETRMALHYEAEFNKMPGRSAEGGPKRTIPDQGRRRSGGPLPLVPGEARLTGPIKGTSSFAADFAGRGPRDSKGRSLRDLDLETRLFRHPCSYLIYSRAFDALPVEVKEYVYRRLWEILTGGPGKGEPQLAAEDRRAIIEILGETKPGLPETGNRRPTSSDDRGLRVTHRGSQRKASPSGEAGERWPSVRREAWRDLTTTFHRDVM